MLSQLIVPKIMSCATLPFLPEEIWDQVFVYSQLTDIKNFRLACRQFYEACNHIRIHRNEEFSFNGGAKSVEALKFLSNSHRKSWNIRLNHVLLDDSILTFFYSQGPRICSLTLKNCEMAGSRNVDQHNRMPVSYTHLTLPTIYSV